MQLETEKALVERYKELSAEHERLGKDGKYGFAEVLRHDMRMILTALGKAVNA